MIFFPQVQWKFPLSPRFFTSYPGLIFAFFLNRSSYFFPNQPITNIFAPRLKCCRVWSLGCRDPWFLRPQSSQSGALCPFLSFPLGRGGVGRWNIFTDSVHPGPGFTIVKGYDKNANSMTSSNFICRISYPVPGKWIRISGRKLKIFKGRISGDEQWIIILIFQEMRTEWRMISRTERRKDRRTSLRRCPPFMARRSKLM